MAVPARKTSKARKNKRRSSVWKMDAPTLVKCPNCGGYAVSHRYVATAATITVKKLSARKRKILHLLADIICPPFLFYCDI